jgi:hypothetical protein
MSLAALSEEPSTTMSVNFSQLENVSFTRGPEGPAAGSGAARKAGPARASSRSAAARR